MPKLEAPKKPAPKPAAKKKPRNPPAKSQQKSSPLPPPVEPESQDQSQQQSQEDSSQGSAGFSRPISEPGLDEPLSAEAERLLSGVPSSIGGEEAEALPGGEVEPDDSDAIAALMAGVSFEESDVRETLCEIFDWIADKAESDHWKLSERQARIWGRPTAQLANACWMKLQLLLPEIFGQWCQTFPGLFGFVTVGAIVVGPKVGKQIKISRERRRGKKVIVGSPASPPAPPNAQPHSHGGLIYEEGHVSQ